jgi:hypothetical protein
LRRITARRVKTMTVNRTIRIRVRTNKNGKQIAHYYGLACRWLPIPVEKAELALATGLLYGCKTIREEG